MIRKAKTTGPGKTVRFTRRQQKRLPRRLLESAAKDWERWDRFAKLEGVNWSTFARRALEQRCASLADLDRVARRYAAPEVNAAFRQRLPGLSEKPPAKNGAKKTGTKARRPGRAEKGSSRS